MGLDATVRCRRFEEGKLKPGPVPLEDLCIDDEGYLWSRKLAAASKKFDHRQIEARYGVLERERASPFSCFRVLPAKVDW